MALYDNIRQMGAEFLKTLLPFLYFSITNYWASTNKVIEGDREIKKVNINKNALTKCLHLFSYGLFYLIVLHSL
jgi:hypothetical protein